MAHRDAAGGRPHIIPSKTPATPHRLTRRPKIESTQVALVAGPEGEEIHPDEYGRIKVWFHFRPLDGLKHSEACLASPNGSTAAPTRTAPTPAGSAWHRTGRVPAGAASPPLSLRAFVALKAKSLVFSPAAPERSSLPRIGMEVMVTHLDGDPDRPLVTGVVPDARQKVPYGLPANKTKTVLRFNTHKGKGRNELTFEEENGQENMFLHAQKDQTIKLLNNRAKRVEANEVASVGQKRSVEVGGNQKHEIGGSINTTVGGTGAKAMALMGQLTGLAPQTASLLQQAGAIADASGGQGAAIGGMVLNLVTSVLGFFSGGGLKSREGAVGSGDTTRDAGNALRQAAGGMGGDTGGILSSLPGMMNTMAGSFKATASASHRSSRSASAR